MGTFEPEDYYNAYSFGLGVDYFVQLSIGYTIKNVKSDLTNEFSAETTVNDFGILLNAPVIKLIDEKLLLPIDGQLNGKPTFNFSLGYSKSNIGDDIVYIDPAQADPLPRIDRTGYGISTGLDLISDHFMINAFNLSFTVEADDILVTRNSTGNWEYESTLSDLQFWKNIVEIEGSKKLSHTQAQNLNLLNLFRCTLVTFQEVVIIHEKTNGFELRAKGLFKLLLYGQKILLQIFSVIMLILYTIIPITLNTIGLKQK